MRESLGIWINITIISILVAAYVVTFLYWPINHLISLGLVSCVAVLAHVEIILRKMEGRRA